MHPWRCVRHGRPGQAVTGPGPGLALLAALGVLIVLVGGCAADRPAGQETTAPPLTGQDRLPPAAVSAQPPVDPQAGRAHCEARRQAICQQQWVGADEKCRRMTCELVAGFWLLRDPPGAAQR